MAFKGPFQHELFYDSIAFPVAEGRPAACHDCAGTCPAPAACAGAHRAGPGPGRLKRISNTKTNPAACSAATSSSHPLQEHGSAPRRACSARLQPGGGQSHPTVKAHLASLRSTRVCCKEAGEGQSPPSHTMGGWAGPETAEQLGAHLLESPLVITLQTPLLQATLVSRSCAAARPSAYILHDLTSCHTGLDPEGRRGSV